jgi:branched-chain amino acid transport system substrate-binding protein
MRLNFSLAYKQSAHQITPRNQSMSQEPRSLSRRTFIRNTAGAAAAASLAGCGGGKPPQSKKPEVPEKAPAAQSDTKKSKNRILLGLTSDSSGQYAASGEMDRRGMAMAIKEFNDRGGLLGKTIESIHQDTETTPATGSRVAERFIAKENVNFLIGALSSGVANAISQVAQKYGCIYLNTNSSAPTESGENAHRVKFVWDGNGTNFAKATVKNAVKSVGKKWLLLTNDYVWGHTTSKANRTLATAEGAEIVDELMVPQNTRDFSSYLIKIRQIKPDVVAAAVGGDDQKVLRKQVADLGMGNSPAWINNQQDWPDIYGQTSLFGVFGTTWYYRLDLPGVKDFVARYQAQFMDAKVKVPGNVLYNGYMATRELFRAIERAGSLNNIAVIKELEKAKVTAEDRMQHFDGWMNPETHQFQQTIYMATQNPKPAEKNDLYKLLSWVRPEDAQDEDSVKKAKLESYEETPVYEPGA